MSHFFRRPSTTCEVYLLSRPVSGKDINETELDKSAPGSIINVEQNMRMMVLPRG